MSREVSFSNPTVRERDFDGATAPPSNDTQAEGGTGRAVREASSTEGVREHPAEPAPFAAIEGSEGYFIAADLRVLSAPKRRMIGGGKWKVMSVHDGRVKIPVRTGGRMVYKWRSVAGLARKAFGGAA